MRPSKCFGLLLVLALAGSGAGCEAEFLQAGPVETCTEVAEQCVLAEGPLGVCERTPCTGGREEPCFMCAPQH